jgi:hypothetical protein
MPAARMVAPASRTARKSKRTATARSSNSARIKFVRVMRSDAIDSICPTVSDDRRRSLHCSVAHLREHRAIRVVK